MRLGVEGWVTPSHTRYALLPGPQPMFLASYLLPMDNPPSVGAMSAGWRQVSVHPNLYLQRYCLSPYDWVLRTAILKLLSAATTPGGNVSTAFSASAPSNKQAHLR